MQVNNNVLSNITALTAAQAQLGESAQKIANVANAIGDPEFQGASQELIDAITSQITSTISYKANGNAIQTQNEISDVILNLKA